MRISIERECIIQIGIDQDVRGRVKKITIAVERAGCESGGLTPDAKLSNAIV